MRSTPPSAVTTGRPWPCGSSAARTAPTAHGEQARALCAPTYSLASAEVQLAYLHQYRGEPSETLRWAGRALGTATEHGFPIRGAGDILGSWSPGRDRDRGRRCRPAPGQAGRVSGHRRRARPPLLPRAARRGRGRDHRRAGRGAAVVDEAIELVGTARPFYYLPELHRLRGDLLARDRRPAIQAAEAYGRAMEIAAGYETRSAELRAAIRLCRLPDGSTPAGRAPPCGGSTTSSTRVRHPDLLVARALLDRSRTRGL